MPRLFMLLIGCSTQGRNIEQHDIYFGIGENIKTVMTGAMAAWPEAKMSFHIDAWREITIVNGFSIKVEDKNKAENNNQLFFINLGGYKRGEFEEFHYKTLAVAADKNEAIKQAKQTAFFLHTGFKGATAHIDDKYGVDVDDIFTVKDILPASFTARYSLIIEPTTSVYIDHIHLGYFKPERVDQWAV